jgi:hypothetical protein
MEARFIFPECFRIVQFIDVGFSIMHGINSLLNNSFRNPVAVIHLRGFATGMNELDPGDRSNPSK